MGIRADQKYNGTVDVGSELVESQTGKAATVTAFFGGTPLVPASTITDEDIPF